MNSSPTFWQFYEIAEKLSDSPGVALEDVIRQTYSYIIRPGDLAIDGGAHHGNHTLPLCEAVGPKGLVYAIEPVPESYIRLEHRLKRKGVTNCRLIRKALDLKAARSSFYYVDTAPGYSGIKKRSYPDHVKPGDIKKIDVETTTIDRLVPRWRNRRAVRFIKLDLEGGEFNALRGAKKTIERNSPVIVFENDLSRTASRYGYTRREFFAFFREHDMNLFALTGEAVEEDWWDLDRCPFYFWALPEKESVSFLRALKPAIERVLIEIRE